MTTRSTTAPSPSSSSSLSAATPRRPQPSLPRSSASSTSGVSLPFPHPRLPCTPRAYLARRRRQFVVAAVDFFPPPSAAVPSGSVSSVNTHARARRPASLSNAHGPDPSPARPAQLPARSPAASRPRAFALGPGPARQWLRGLRQHAPAPCHGRVSATLARARLSATWNAVTRVDLDPRSGFSVEIAIRSLDSQSSPYDLSKFQKIAEKPPVFKFK